MTNDGWAVTSPSFIDAAVMVFDFGERRSVSRAVLSLPLEALYPRSGKAPLRVFAFADDGRIDLSDYTRPEAPSQWRNWTPWQPPRAMPLQR
jgi:hypothetical protein